MFFNRVKHSEIVVVVPIYKNILDEEEMLALKLINTHLHKYDIVYICPRKIKNAEIVTGSHIEFDDHWFRSANTYSELLLSSFFYEKFSKYKYMLIVQLDALIFRDDLLYWANKHYDYIGAPWMFKISDYMPYLNTLVPKYAEISEKNKWFVGNGGLSLRNIRSFLFILDKYKTELDDYKRRIKPLNWGSDETPPMNEDIFWGLYIPSIFSKFKIPNYKTAINFSIETQAEPCLKMLKGRLPFGCHAWNKHGKEMWLNLLKERGII